MCDRSRSGMSLIGVIVALSVMGILMVSLVRFFGSANKSSEFARMKSTQTTLLNQLSSFGSNPTQYVEILSRSPYGASFVLNCLQPASPACPSAAADLSDAPEVLEEAGASAFVAEFPIVASSGKILAGTNAPGEQSLYASTGADCSDPNTCPLRARGYLVMDSPNDPSSLRFIMSVGLNPGALTNLGKNVPLSARSMTLNIGSHWKQPGVFSTVQTYAQITEDVGVPKGEVLSTSYMSNTATKDKIEETHTKLVDEEQSRELARVRDVAQSKQGSLTCPEGQYMTGINLDLSVQCASLQSLETQVIVGYRRNYSEKFRQVEGKKGEIPTVFPSNVKNIAFQHSGYSASDPDILAYSQNDANGETHYGLFCNDKKGWRVLTCSNSSAGMPGADTDYDIFLSGKGGGGCQTNDWNSNDIGWNLQISCWRFKSEGQP